MSSLAFGSIELAIDGDTKGLGKDIERNLGSSFRKVAGIAAAAFASARIGDGIKKAILGASDLTESINAINVSLGTGADSFLKFGKSAATNLGLTQAALNQAIVPAAAILRNTGLAGDVLSSKLQVLAKRATDVGSVFNATTTDVLESFNAALRGENDPIQRFGVMLNEASIAAKAVELGLAGSTKQVSQSAKTMAAYELILEQTEGNSGDFKNTSDGLANSLKILKANTTELRDELGAKLAPVATAAVDWLQKLVTEARNGEGPLANLQAAARGVGDYLQTAFGDAFSTLGARMQEAGPGIATLLSELGDLGVTVLPVLTNAINLAAEVVGVLVLALGKVGDWAGEHQAIFGTLVTIIATFTAVMGGWTIATSLAASATAALASATWGLNYAMSANVILIVVAAVAALAVGFKYAWDHSETFREIVVGVFNHVKDAVLTAVGIMFEVFTFFIRGVLNGISGLAGAWTHLPEFLGGGDNGWASKVKGAVDGVLSGLDAIQDGINSLKGRDLVIGIRVTVEEFSAANSDSGFNARAAERATGTGEAIDSAGIALGNALAGIKDKVSKIGTGGGGGGSIGGGGGGGGSAGKAAKDAAAAAKKAAAAAAAAALKAGKKQITASKFIDSITGDKAGIDTALDKLYDSLKAANKTKAAAMVKELNKDLTKLAGKRDAVSIKLDNAKDALKDIKNESKSYSASIKQAILDTGNVANNNTITFTGVRNSMRAAVRQAVAFKDAVAALTKAGLNKNNLSQIIDAGPEAGLAAAKAIQQGGKKGITELNALNTQLTAAGTAMGSTTADTFYKAGISAAQGLVNGLQSQENALQKQMDKLAMGMVKSLKKELKIKSPSQVFEGLGNYVGQGLARGVDASRGGVATAGRNLGASVVFGAGSVLVNGVSDPNAARTSGMLVGGAAADSIARSRELAALAGMG